MRSLQNKSLPNNKILKIMIQNYIKLQINLFKRNLYAATLLPNYLTLSLLLIIFIGISIILAEKAPLIHTIILFYLLLPLSETNRNDFLKTCFSNKDYKKIRFMENLFLALPFITITIIWGFIFKLILLPFALVFILISYLFSFFSFKIPTNRPIPTPFYKKPFEFIIGFRYTFFLFIILYILAFIAIKIDNFNLGVFSLVSVFLLVFHYYLKHENVFYIWIHSLTPKRFLLEKIKTAVLYTLYLYLPILLLLIVTYPAKILVLMIIILLGYVYLALVIMLKYKSFPNEISIIDTFITLSCFVFPPLLLFVFPYFTKKSIQTLEFYL